MKNLIKITSLLLAFILILPTFVMNASALDKIVFTEIETIEMDDFRFAAEALPLAVETLDTEITETYERYGKLILSQMENSENLLKAYALFSEGIANLSEKIQVAYSGAYISKEEFHTVYNIVLCDFPEYFWIGTTCSYSMNFTGKYVTYIYPSYIMTASQVQTEKAKLDTAVTTITSGLEGKSDYKIAKLLHDRISLKTDYVETVNDQTAYGALVEKEAVCAGYARSYQLLLTTMGIPAWTVTGVSSVPGSTSVEPHAWNIVYLNGEWYYTDVTWDDQGSTTDEIYYAYFNVTTEQLFEDHTPDADIAPYLPDCTATKNNYFKIKKWESESFDKNVMVNSIKRCGGYSRIYITGDIEQYYNDVQTYIADVVFELDLVNVTSYSLLLLGREIRVVFDGEYVPNGDANGDLSINVKDTLIMKKYLSGMEDITEISVGNADMNGDGRIASTDILKVRKRISGV